MRRRAFLAAGVGSLTAASGCLGGGGGDGGTTTTRAPCSDAATGDGYPAASGTTPEEATFGDEHFAPHTPSEYPDATVTLASIDAVNYWHGRGDARFVDARGLTQYREAHVRGAVSSPAATAVDCSVAEWPRADRVVCYCGCPHHLSAMRAAELQSVGFEDVYVLDEGFWAWVDRGYPVRGSQVNDVAPPRAWTVRGVAGDGDAGGSVWLRHPPSGQREVAPVRADGTFAVTARFYDVSAESEVTLETPTYRRVATLGTLADGVVAPPA